MRSKGILLGWLLLGLSGCQCCTLFDHYAAWVDCVADDEHHFERIYVPAWDLNRIGRPDWCQCRLNRAFCRCACDRCKPAPCEYVVCQERLIPPTRISQPDWSQEEGLSDDPAEMFNESTLEPLPPVTEEQAEEELLLPQP